MLPARGPSLWRITAVEKVIAAGATGVAVTYRWPKPVTIKSLFIYPKSNVFLDAASLSFSIEDQNGFQLVSNGLQQQTCPCLALMGKGKRRFPTSMYVANLDSWNITFNNTGAVSVTPIMLVEFENDAS